MTSRSAGWSSIPIGDEGCDRAPAATDAARAVFGDRLPVAAHFADLLAGDGVRKGLIGPQEAPRLWDRHLVNCAVVAELLPIDAHVVDVGSGAGLPGLALACLRPDLSLDLVDSMQRRTAFLTEAVALLDLADRVRVVTGRAEDREVVRLVGSAGWVTARAVAPLDRLGRWCLPLLAATGTLLALKGDRAAAEVAQHGAALRRLGARSIRLVRCGVGRIDEPTSVVRIVRR